MWVIRPPRDCLVQTDPPWSTHPKVGLRLATCTCRRVSRTGRVPEREESHRNGLVFGSSGVIGREWVFCLMLFGGLNKGVLFFSSVLLIVLFSIPMTEMVKASMPQC